MAGASRRVVSNKYLVHEGGNQYETPNMFYSVPLWWRRFMFTVLTPRDFIIYSYICSHTDQFGIAFPTYANIKADLNISNARIIRKSLDNLVGNGFLLVKRLPPRPNRHPRNIYQRPCIEFTLRVLLTNKKITEDLIPRNRAEAAKRGDYANRDSQAIFRGLRGLFTEPAWTRIWSVAKAERAAALGFELQSIVDRKRTEWETNDAPQMSDDDRKAAESALQSVTDEDDGFGLSGEVETELAEAGNGDPFPA